VKVESDPSHITDHAFEPPDGRWWGPCGRCGLGEAAHRDTKVPQGQQHPVYATPSAVAPKAADPEVQETLDTLRPMNGSAPHHPV
jgi:hypothetical protein